MNHPSFEDSRNSLENEPGQEKLSGGEIRVQNRFLGALANFWYHYKWYVIVILFFVVTFAICFAQCATNDQSDVSVLIAGPGVLSAEEKSALIAAMNELLPRDFNENGKKTTALFSFVNYTEAELQAAYDKAIAENPDEDVTVAATAYINQLRSVSNSDLSNYSTAVSAGECAILVVSESLYEKLRDGGRLEPLENVLTKDSVPVHDGYAVRLTDTVLYTHYDAAKALPEGLLLCFLKQPILGTIHDNTEYSNAKEMFRAMVGD